MRENFELELMEPYVRFRAISGDRTAADILTEIDELRYAKLQEKFASKPADEIVHINENAPINVGQAPGEFSIDELGARH